MPMTGPDIPSSMPVNGRTRRWWGLLVALTLLVYGLGVSPYWRVGMDQAFYTSIARSVATGQGYSFCAKTQWSIPPVTPLYLAAAYKLGHWIQPGISFLDTFVYLNAFMCVAGLTGLVTAVFLVREIVAARSRSPDAQSRRPIDLTPAALVIIASGLVAFSGRYYRLSMEEMTDVPYCIVSWAAILFLLRSWRTPPPPAPQASGRRDLAVSAFFLAVAPLVRMTAGALILSVAASFILRAVSAKRRLHEAALGMAVLAPAAVTGLAMLASIWLGRDTGAFSYLSTDRDFARGLPAWSSNAAEIPARLFGVLFGLGSRTAPGIVVLPVVVAGAVAWWRAGQRFIVSYVVLSLAVTTALERPQTRYFVPLLPFIYLFAIEGVLLFAGWAVTGMSRVAAPARTAAARKALVAGAVGLLALTLAANLRQIYGAVSLNFGGDFYHRYQKGEYYDYFALARDLASAPPQGAVMAREHRVIFALSEAPGCPPFRIRASGSPDVAEITDYILDNAVAAIVIDPRHAESARAFADYVQHSPLAWRVTGTYGTLTVYSRVR